MRKTSQQGRSSFSNEQVPTTRIMDRSPTKYTVFERMLKDMAPGEGSKSVPGDRQGKGRKDLQVTTRKRLVSEDESPFQSGMLGKKSPEVRKNTPVRASPTPSKVARKRESVKDGASPRDLNKPSQHCMPVRIDSKRVNQKAKEWAMLIDNLKKRKTAVDAQIDEFIERNGVDPTLLRLSMKEKVRSAFQSEKLLKLPMIGIKCHLNKCSFDWPTLRDIRNLQVSEPLRLTTVRLKGLTSLEGIQLVFNDGKYQSPFLCGNESEPPSPESTQLESLVHSFKVDGRRRIAHVKVSIDKHVEITRLAMYYEAAACGGGADREPQMAFGHTFEARGRAYTEAIPDGHSIVGIYGKYECADITSLGFIVSPSAAASGTVATTVKAVGVRNQL